MTRVLAQSPGCECPGFRHDMTEGAVCNTSVVSVELCFQHIPRMARLSALLATRAVHAVLRVACLRGGQ